MSMKGADILIECLKSQGVGSVFGMPGTQNNLIYDALLRCGDGVIDHYLVRHEWAATKMADGCARAGGDVGVALTVPGPGASNAATGILEAYSDCVPVLLITGQSNSKFYSKDQSKMFHGLDQMRFFEPCTKYCAIVRKVEDIPVAIEKAFHEMRTGRPGPVVLEFPSDVVSSEADVVIPPRIKRAEGPAPKPNDIRSVAEILKRSKMPVLFAGSAVVSAGACTLLRKLAEKLNAPGAVSRRAKGALPEDHPLAIRNSYGFLAGQAFQRADCTLVIGVRFTSVDSSYWSIDFPRPMIQIEEDTREIGREYACDFSVEADLKLTLEALIEAVDEREDVWTPALEEFRKKFNTQPPLPILPEIREVLPEDGIIAVDVCSLGYGSFAEYPVYRPETFLYPCIAVSLGYAFPAAIGAKVACPDKPVVCFIGDGGFMMGAAELSTAMKYGINVVTVVVNDGALCAIKGSQKKGFEGRTIGTELHNPDFVKFAESFGAYTARVEDLSDFKAILQNALAADRPALIEVPMHDRQEELVTYIDWLHSEPLRKGASI